MAVWATSITEPPVVPVMQLLERQKLPFPWLRIDDVLSWKTGCCTKFDWQTDEVEMDPFVNDELSFVDLPDRDGQRAV